MSTCCSRMKLFTRRPAPIRSMTVSAVWDTTSRLRSRCCVTPPVWLRLSCLRAWLTSAFQTISAGGSPLRRPDSTAMTKANASRVQLKEISGRGKRCESEATSRSLPRTARTAPSSAAMSARHTLSVSSCRTRRPAPAPSALRTASSRWRARPLASTRLPTLAHPISNTKTPAPRSTRSGVLTGPTATSRRGTTLTPRPSFESGNAFSSPAAIASSSAWAAAAVTPGFSRATARR